MYARTSFNFRGAKNVQNWGKKGCVFSHIDKFGKDMKTKLRKTHAKTHMKGLFSYLKNMRLGCILKAQSRLGCILKAQSPFTGMIFHGGTRIFFCGGIEGAKCDSEGANIQKFAKNGTLMTL